MEEDYIIGHVLAAIRSLVNDPSVPIDEHTVIPELDVYDSLFLFNLIEAIETQLNIELNPSLIIPESFVTPRTLARACMQSIPLVRHEPDIPTRNKSTHVT